MILALFTSHAKKAALNRAITEQAVLIQCKQATEWPPLVLRLRFRKMASAQVRMCTLLEPASSICSHPYFKTSS